MSQELQVLQCYKCQIFQVQIVKKVPKWFCKMCGEKQSVKKVFFQGTGKDCRLTVQEYNELSMSAQEKQMIYQKSLNYHNEISPNLVNVDSSPKSNKWDTFVENQPKQNENIEAQEDLNCFTFERPEYKRRRSLNKKEYGTSKKSKFVETSDDNFVPSCSTSVLSSSQQNTKNSAINNELINTFAVSSTSSKKNTNTGKWGEFIKKKEIENGTDKTLDIFNNSSEDIDIFLDL